MKTLDEIINNEKYTRLNGALQKRSIELANKIRKAMCTAEVTQIGDYSISTVRTNSGNRDTSLYIKVREGEPDDYPEYRSLEHDKSHYFCGDGYCWIEAAKGRDRLKFLNDARKILEEIDNIKQQRIANVEEALKAIENI